jgi:hypothetical protein
VKVSQTEYVKGTLTFLFAVKNAKEAVIFYRQFDDGPKSYFQNREE